MTQEKDAAKDFFGMKAKRESLGMTLKDVFALTRISVANLEAIENGDFQALPVAIYAKNFIKIYAQALDLDSKPVLDSYESYWKSPQADIPAMPAQVNEKRIKKITPEQEEEIKQEETVLKRSFSYKKLYIALASIGVAVAAFIIMIFFKQEPLPNVAVNQPSMVKTDQNPPVAMTTSVAPPPADSTVNPPAQPAPVSQPAATLPPASNEAIKQASSQPVPAQQKSATPVEPAVAQNAQAAIEKKETVSYNEGADVLLIKATEATWLKIKIDQNPPFQVLLKPGEAIKRKGSGFAVDIGNAGGVIINFKGKTMENLGKSGEVRHLQLP